MAAISPPAPTMAVVQNGNSLQISITASKSYPQYKVGVRGFTFDWDSVYVLTTPQTTIQLSGAGPHYVSAAVVDSNGVESFFSDEVVAFITGINEPNATSGIYLQQAKPNPFDEATVISVLVQKPVVYQKASIKVTDSNGQTDY